MITLKIAGTITVEGASNNEEAIAAVKEVAGGTEIESVTRGGPDASPVYMVRLKDHVVTLEEGEVEEGPPVPEEPTPEGEAAGKEEFAEIKE